MMAREPAEHFCPWKPKAEATIPSAAASRSAVSSTTTASLPPISRMVRLSQRCPLRGLAASSLIRRPTSREPVKAVKRSWRCAGMFEHDCIASYKVGTGHTDHNSAGEVPRRNDRTHAQGNIHQLVILALDVCKRLIVGQPHHLACIIFHEVDSFRSIAIGLSPTLAHLVDHPGIKMKSPLAHQIGSREKIPSSLFRRNPL